MKTRTLLFIIDMQYDFCAPEGSLFVNGADKDVARTGEFIKEFESKIDHIILTIDNHHVIDISHPVFWEDNNGNPPPPFTVIKPGAVIDGSWKPRFEKEKAVAYIQKLESQGEFPHVIWPEHCIIGSHGAAIVNEVLDPVKAWARKGNYYDVVIKGNNPITEHFGALMANVPIEEIPETQLNMGLVKKLQTFDKILVAGEAKSHCVATTISQILNHIGNIAPKLVILENCMSDVTGFETIAIPIYERAKSEGAQFILSTDWLQ